MKMQIFLFIILVIIVLLLTIGKRSISTQIIINASVDQVWKELTDFAKYPEWNPFIRKLSGEIKTGNRIEVIFQIEGTKPMKFTPEIKVIEKNKMFQWEGHLLIPGIFTGKHTFLLVPMEANKTKLIQKEDFKGILVPFFKMDTTVQGFELMNRAFKERVEKKNGKLKICKYIY